MLKSEGAKKIEHLVGRKIKILINEFKDPFVLNIFKIILLVLAFVLCLLAFIHLPEILMFLKG
jgi:hypothetical protein